MPSKPLDDPTAGTHPTPAAAAPKPKSGWVRLTKTVEGIPLGLSIADITAGKTVKLAPAEAERAVAAGIAEHLSDSEAEAAQKAPQEIVGEKAAKAPEGKG